MLDLDTLASSHAKTLHQQEEAWKKAVWSAPFQKLTQTMSDGDVEKLLVLCPSVSHLEAVVQFLTERQSASKNSPMLLLDQAAQQAGMGLGDWLSQQFKK